MTDAAAPRPDPPPIGAPPRRVRFAAALASLLPWRLFFGPVFQKEMRVSGRKLGTYLARAAYALILALVVAIAFWQAWENLGHTNSRTARIQSLQGIAPIVVLAVLWFQFIATLLLAPVMTGGAICEERRAQTLPTLLTTPLTALQIVCSKIASRLTHLLILALLALPILLGVRLFGGVRAETVLAGATLTIVTALLAAAVGVLMSTITRRATVASLLTYVLLAVIFIGPPLLALRYNSLLDEHLPNARLPDLLGGWAPDWPAYISESVIVTASAPAALGVVFVEPEPGLPYRQIWVGSASYTLALALLATVCSAASVRRVMRRSMVGAATAPRRRRRRRSDADAPDAEPVAIVHRRSRTLPDRPVLWRELRQPLFDRRRWLVLAIIVLLIVAGLTYPGATDEEGVAIVPVILGMILLLLQAALLSAPGFGAEREARTLDTLLTTRLSPAEIVWGKAIGAVRRQWFVPLVIMAHTALLVALGQIHWIVLVHLPIVMLGPIVMLAGTGVLLGLRFRKSVTASAVNLALALALWLAWPILMALLFGLLEIAPYDVANVVANVTIMLNPVGVCVFVIDMAHGSSGLALDDLSYDMPLGDVGPGFFTLLLAACSGVQAAIGLAAIARATVCFTKYTGRAS